jgi:hypothetical protein
MNGTATHPWELPGYSEDEIHARALPQAEGDDAEQQSAGNDVQLPVMRGPAFAAEDTLDPATIPGQWLQVCVSADEKIDIPPYAELDMLELREDGSMTWNVRSADNQSKYLEGQWAKSGPGLLSLTVTGGQPVPLNCQLFGKNFLFAWSYDQKLGHWFARLPATGAERITRNRFKTTFGNMIFTEVGDKGFRGEVDGEYTRTIGGLYLPGVITMRWEEGATRSGGFAAFIVDADFKTLDGVWWLDDYEAAPFGGAWTGTADDSIPIPAAKAGTDGASK